MITGAQVRVEMKIFEIMAVEISRQVIKSLGPYKRCFFLFLNINVGHALKHINNIAC